MSSSNNRNRSKERRDTSRDRDVNKSSKPKRKPPIRPPSRSASRERRQDGGSPYNDYNMSYPPEKMWGNLNQYGPPPPPRHMFPGPALLPNPGMPSGMMGPRMYHHNNYMGAMYTDFGRPYGGYHDYGYENYPPPQRDGPRFGENVLEKAENMVNDLAEKRKQAEDRNNRKKNLPDRSRSSSFSRPDSRIEVAKPSSSTGNSPRVTVESWNKITSKVSKASTSREISPNRPKPSAKPDASKVASKADTLSRASIAKLINAPRSHKERQRLASLVKKTKPKTLRPKLSVHAVPEVGAVDAAPIEVNEILDLVELPENLRQQVENLLENGPDTGLATRSPTKSPVAKKAKKDYKEQQITLSDLDTTPVKIEPESVTSSVQDLASLRIKKEPDWDSESVISDVTSIGQSEPDRRPFERLADKVTVDPKLNRILDAADGLDSTPSEAGLMDKDRIEALVNEALGTSPKVTTTSPKRTAKSPKRAATSPKRTTSPKRSTTSPKRATTSPSRTSTSPNRTEPPRDVFKRPEDPKQSSLSRLKSPERHVERVPGPKSPHVTEHSTTVPDPPCQTSTVTESLTRDDVETNTDLVSHASPHTDPSQRDRTHPLAHAAKNLAMSRIKLREMGETLMSLHEAIHAPQKQEDTVNLVLEITEREEQLSSELRAIDSHTEILNRLISDASLEMERLMRLRESVKDDGDILRKQRLEVLRSAVSKQKEQNVTSSTGSQNTNTAQTVTSTSEGASNIADDSNQSTPRNPEPVENKCVELTSPEMRMQYVGSFSVDQIQNANIWESVGHDIPTKDTTPLSRSLDQQLLDKLKNTDDSDECLDTGNEPDEEILTLAAKSRKRRKPGLGVKMNFPSKSKRQIKEKLLAKDSKKMKQQKSVFMELCRELSPTEAIRPSKEIRFDLGSLDDSKQTTEDESGLETPRIDTGTDDVTESELDCPDKVKARLLRAVKDDSEFKVNDKERLAVLKHQLLQTLDTGTVPDPILDPLVQSSMLDDEISQKLRECSVALYRLQDNKKKTRERTSSEPTPSTSQPVPVTSQAASTAAAEADSVSVISDAVTSQVSSSSPTKRRRQRRPREDKMKAKARSSRLSSSNSEYESDDVRHTARTSSSKASFPSDSRKDKLRQMGVILSASELEEYCKDGHNISDRESSAIETARTEDLMIDTPRTVDTARTDDLLQPIQPDRPTTVTTSATPFDDSDVYSSCLESIEDEPEYRRTNKQLLSTGESLATSLPESQQSEQNQVPFLLLTGDGASTLDSDYESKDKQDESERSKDLMLTDRSEKSQGYSEGQITDRSDNSENSEAYKERIRQILNESTTDIDTEMEIWEVKRERRHDDVMIIGESSRGDSHREPLSGRSDKSLPPVAHKKQKYSGHTNSVTCMVLHDNYMYTCSPQDSTIRKFNMETADCVHVFQGTTKNIYTMLVLEHNQKTYLYTGGYDCKLVKYDLDSHEAIHTQTLSAKVRCLVTKWDKVFIGLCSGEILALSPENETHKSLVGSGKSVSCMDTGVEGSRQVLVVGSFDPLIAVHDAKNGLLLRTISSHARVPLSVKTHHNYIFSAGADKCVKQHDLNSGEELKSIHLHHPVTDLVIHDSNLYVACFDGLIRCFNRDLELKRLYYGAGKNYLLRLGVSNDRLYSTNKNGSVESMPIVEDLYMCQSNKCRLGFGLICDLEYHVTEKHVESRVEKHAPVYFCTWIGCCFETAKRMDLENHLLNHVENLMNDD